MIDEDESTRDRSINPTHADGYLRQLFPPYIYILPICNVSHRYLNNCSPKYCSFTRLSQEFIQHTKAWIQFLPTACYCLHFCLWLENCTWLFYSKVERHLEDFLRTVSTHVMDMYHSLRLQCSTLLYHRTILCALFHYWSMGCIIWNPLQKYLWNRSSEFKYAID